MNTNNNAYVPTKLVKLIQESDYKRKDDLYIILDLIYRKQSYLPSKLFKKYLYVELSAKYINNFLSSNTFAKAAMVYLQDEGYIIINDKYSTGSFAKSYKVAPKYLGKTVKVEITDRTINKKINKFKTAMREVKVKNNEKTKKKYFKEFNLDYDAAIKATEDNALNDLRGLCNEMKLTPTKLELMKVLADSNDKTIVSLKIILVRNGKFLSILHRMMSHQMCVRAIKDGYLYFKRNGTNGRLDSNLSNLPTYLRKYLKTDTNVFNVDFKNSQPFFLYCTLKTIGGIDQEELDKYKALVEEGILYDYLAGKWNESNKSNPKNRIQAKMMVFKILFSKVKSYTKYKELFYGEFPTIMEWINETNFADNSTVATMMTLKESFTILDVIKPKLSKLGIEPYTIHDSFLCNEDEVETVEMVINESCLEMFDIVPSLHKTNILEEGIDEITIEDEEDTYDYGDGFDAFIN